MKRNAYLKALIGLVIVVITVAAFSRVGNFAFLNYDDDLYVTANPQVQKGLTFEGVRWAFTTFHSYNWHPLTWLSLELDSSLYGLNASGFHVTNVLLHSLAALCLFLVLHRLTGALWRSALVAAFFAIHPLRVESVAWVAERKDVLSGLCFMLTLYAYTAWVERPTHLRYLVVATTFLLGLMAKPILVTLPFVLLLLDYWPLERALGKESEIAGDRAHRFRSLVWEKLPLFLLSAATCGITSLAQKRGGAIVSLKEFPIPARVGNALISYVGYIGQVLFPHDLVPFHQLFPTQISMTSSGVAGLLILGSSVAVLRQATRRPYLVVGWLWFLGTLVPAIGLVQVGHQSMADRYTYIPFIGLAVAVVWAAEDLCFDPERWRLAAFCSSVLVGLCLILTRSQGEHWRDSVALWTHVIRVDPKSVSGHYQLGIAYHEQKNEAEAKHSFQRAFEVAQDLPLAKKPSVSVVAMAHENLGAILFSEGKLTQAREHLSEAARLDPEKGENYDNLGRVLFFLSDFEGAARNLIKALDKGYVPQKSLCYDVSEQLAHQGKIEDASHLLRNLAATYVKLGRPGRAAQASSKFRELASGPR